MAGTPSVDPSSPSSRHPSRTSSSLNRDSTRPVFYYKLRDGCGITTEAELASRIEADGNLRCASKPIPRGASRVAVQNCDLWLDTDRESRAHLPNSKSSIASVGLPRSVYWRRMLMGQFKSLYIVSPETSPTSSEQSSGHSWDADSGFAGDSPQSARPPMS